MTSISIARMLDDYCYPKEADPDDQSVQLFCCFRNLTHFGDLFHWLIQVCSLRHTTAVYSAVSDPPSHLFSDFFAYRRAPLRNLVLKVASPLDTLQHYRRHIVEETVQM